MSKRVRSPASENTLVNNLLESGIGVRDEDELSDSFVNNIVDSESEISDNDVDIGFGDDTDDDPDYQVSQSSSESDGDLTPARGRPRCSRSVPLDPNTVDAVIDEVVADSTNASNNHETNPSPNTASWTVIEENNDPGFPHSFSFEELPGPKHCPPHDSPPIAYFDLFFTVGLLTSFVQMTNKYAREYIANNTRNLSPNSRALQWKNVTVAEIKAFIATILNMGLIKKPTIQSYWSTTDHMETPWFRKMFSRNRFECILQFFHIVDNSSLSKPGHPDYDPSAKFAPVLDHANRIFRLHYTPHRELSIDESLIGTKSHTQLLQYLPNKHHHRWGIKMWMLCDSVTKYCLAFFCYRGSKDSAKGGTGLAFTVVNKLLQIGQYLQKGYHIFVDNFFTSIPLAQYLYDNCTFLTGTIRKNRKGIPPQLTQKFTVGQKAYMRKDNLLFLAYREKKSQKQPVLLLSSKETAESVTARRKKAHEQNPKIKPKVIDSYNMYMGGIDGSDQMLYCYLDERRTVKYWKKVVFNIFGRMILNSYILYKENTSGKELTRLQYTSAIIEHLSKEWLQYKNQPSTSRTSMGGAGDGPQNCFGLVFTRQDVEKLQCL